jgi:CO/xanthine dehydrogenase Mo-binding subunit
MNSDLFDQEPETVDPEMPTEFVNYGFGLNRRSFVQILGAGIAVVASPTPAFGQQRAGGGGNAGDAARNVAARIHIATDGKVTVMTGKVEVGQNSRGELTQAAAEELRLSPSQIHLVMADTSLVPNDGITAGSRSTPATVPIIRRAAAAARNILMDIASQKWSVERSTVEVRDGKVLHPPSNRTSSYGELAQAEDAIKRFAESVPPGVVITPVKEWKVLGTSVPRPNGRDLVTGAHQYPSDIGRPGMLRGKVLRPPSYGARLISIDLAPAKAMKDVVAVHDGQFVGVAAPTTYQADQALKAVAEMAKWETAPHPSSKELSEHLRKNAQGGVPANPFAKELAEADKKFKQTFNVAYVQHAPMETRSTVAEFTDGKLTVWTGTQNPFGYLGEIARALRISADNIRVIVPDTGGGFGGKHTAEATIEAARLAQAAGKPVSLKWTREEEFTWASFRPGAVIDIEAGLDAKGTLTSWHFITINPGQPAMNTPYQIARAQSNSVNSSPPLRHGSYRALASTANNFAREAFMDELAASAGADPLDFRLAHLENARLRAVLEEAAKRFNWRERVKKKEKNIGVGLACGTEKGSYVAACVEIAIDEKQKKIVVKHVCEVFECGAIINPDNLLAQVEGAIVMGLGPVLREEMHFDDGKMRNASFHSYLVPRFSDVPKMDIHLLNRPDLPSVGGGETPIIAVAPAIANAVFHATGQRVREMPIRLA